MMMIGFRFRIFFAVLFALIHGESSFGGQSKPVGAEELSLADAVEIYQDFLVTVKVFTEFETVDGTYADSGFKRGRKDSSASLAALRVLMMELPSVAYAADGENVEKLCLLAGHVGMVKGGRCVPKSGVKLFDEKGNLNCGKDTFGPGIQIQKPRDSRWTRACANEVLKRAGIEKDIMSADLSDEETLSLGKFLRNQQAVSFKNNLFVSVLSKCQKVGVGEQDRADCKRLSDVFTRALNAFSIKKTDTLEKCWDAWTDTGAVISANRDLPVGKQFDSLIYLDSLGGCRLNFLNGDRRGDGCLISKGSKIQMLGIENGDSSRLRIKAGVSCPNPGNTKRSILKAQEMKLVCASGLIQKLPFRMTRMLNRNFSLSPPCDCDLRTDAERREDNLGDKMNFDPTQGR